MFTELPEIFGSVLRDARKKKGLSQMALAAAAGIHINGVSSLERGRRAPSLHTVLVLARALDVDAWELVAAVEKAGKKLWR